MSSSIQLSFSLRVSSGVKSVHLIGSWDGYNNQLPLSKDKTSSKSGSWKGTFRFSSGSIEAGERYWYYYIIDGYHCAHNPSVSSTVEPTTGRELNILDVPEESRSSSSSKSSSKSSSHKSSSSSSKSSSHKSSSSSHKSSSSSKDKNSHRLTVDIPKGRPLSASQIKCPKPMSPHATKHILKDFDNVDDLSARFAAAELSDDEIVPTFSRGSPASSAAGSGFSYRSSSPSSASGSGYSTPGSEVCTCERYGITRKGDRVKLDCGGAVCGYADSDCESEASVDYSRSSRRHGVVVR